MVRLASRNDPSWSEHLQPGASLHIFFKFSFIWSIFSCWSLGLTFGRTLENVISMECFLASANSPRALISICSVVVSLLASVVPDTMIIRPNCSEFWDSSYVNESKVATEWQDTLRRSLLVDSIFLSKEFPISSVLEFMFVDFFCCGD